MKSGCKLQGNMGKTWRSAEWIYLNFIRNGHLRGYFNINVTLIVTNDDSVKTKTANGVIFLFFFIPWAVIEEV